MQPRRVAGSTLGSSSQLPWLLAAQHLPIRPAHSPPARLNPHPCRLGTIDYIAPEILDCPTKKSPLENKDNPAIGYSNKVDCWSVGVLAYELCCGCPPFAAVGGVAGAGLGCAGLPA
jgi:serine/threonine protein kinase